MAGVGASRTHPQACRDRGVGTAESAALAAGVGLVTVVVALVYVPAVLAGLGFVSDDFMILERLRQADGLRGGWSFFTLSYYDYYRPLGFLSFASDWTMWRDSAPGYHAVSVLLHLFNTVMVLLVARRLIGTRAAMVAAAIFGLHVANQEAVFWVSARFDLLATAGALAVLLALGTPGRWRLAGVALLYLAALLSKESVVAVPVATGAYAWLIQRERTAGLVRVFAWLGAAGVIYVLLRHASGLPSAGGESRLPKLAVLIAIPLLQLAAAHPSTGTLRGWLRARRDWVFAALLVAIAAAGAGAWASAPGSALRGALGSSGFAVLHLASPISVERWLFPLPWWLGFVGWTAAVAAVAAGRRVVAHKVPAFLAFFLVSALVPVSSMTEGARYLYLASVPVAIFAAWCVAQVEGRPALVVRAGLVLILIAFAWQVRAKGRDWLWASDMTSRSVAAIVDVIGPGCVDAHIILATAPVRIRGVYANLNYEGLSALGQCRPASLRTLVRLGYDDPQVTATLDADRLTLRIEPYTGGFVTSMDLRRYSILIEPRTTMRLTNDLGAFEASPDGSGLLIRQSLPPGVSAGSFWFVFSRGRLSSLASKP